MTYEEALYYHTHNSSTIEQEIDCEILIKSTRKADTEETIIKG